MSTTYYKVLHEDTKTGKLYSAVYGQEMNPFFIKEYKLEGWNTPNTILKYYGYGLFCFDNFDSASCFAKTNVQNGIARIFIAQVRNPEIPAVRGIHIWTSIYNAKTYVQGMQLFYREMAKSNWNTFGDGAVVVDALRLLECIQ